MSSKTEFKTEAPSLYKKDKTAEPQQSQPAPVVNKDKKQKERRPKTAEGGAQRPKPKNNRTVSGAAAARTLYIGKVYVDELDSDAKRSQQLNQERMKLLKEVFARFGEVERFEPHPQESFVHVAYKDRKSAEDAIANLSQRSNRDEIMDELKEQLKKSKLPENVCPVLWKYRYEWSKPSTESPSEARPKTAVAKKTDQPATPPTANGAQVEKKKKEKKKKEEGEAPKPKEISTEKKQVAPKAPTTQNLQLEAERARLSQDLEYLRTQHKSVQRELSSERDRCSSRDERIKRLQEEHGRVHQHAMQLESQLKTDLTWKAAAEERTAKLSEEIEHILQQQQLVQTMLKTVSDL